MMKSLTAGLGVLTALAVTGMATPSGQAVLGLHQAQTAAPISVIADPGTVAVAPTPARPAAVAVPAAPAPASTVAPRTVATAPVARPVPAARPASPAPAAAPVPAANPAGTVGAITNILLNLPQVMQQTQVRPAAGPSGDEQQVPPGHRFPKAKKQHDDDDDGTQIR